MFSRKKLLVFLVFVMMIVFVTSCSNSNEPDKMAVEKSNVEADLLDSVSQEDEPAKIDSAEEVEVEEQVLFDQDDIKITLKSLKDDSIFGPSLQVLVENNSEQSIIVQTRDSSVNDLMVETMFSANVAAGKKANDSITFMSSELEQAGISTIQNIEFKFYIFNADTWSEVLESEVITIETSADKSFVQDYDDEGVLVLDEKGIKMVIKKVNSSDSFWGTDVYVYIENNSDQDITIQSRDVSINGFMVSPIFSSDIVAGKKAFDSITFFENDLVENEITSIDNMELSFHIFESNGWNTILDTQPIEVTFE